MGEKVKIRVLYQKQCTKNISSTDIFCHDRWEAETQGEEGEF